MAEANIKRSQAILRMPVDMVDAVMFMHDGHRSEVLLFVPPSEDIPRLVSEGQVGHVAPVLLVERQVEAELAADVCHRLRRGAAAGDLPGRIGGKDVEQHEGDQRDADQDQHRLQEPPGQIGGHQ
jgi:hypothetical protein